MCRFVHWYGTPPKKAGCWHLTTFCWTSCHMSIQAIWVYPSRYWNKCWRPTHTWWIWFSHWRTEFGAAMHLKTWVRKGVCQDIYFWSLQTMEGSSCFTRQVLWHIVDAHVLSFLCPTIAAYKFEEKYGRYGRYAMILIDTYLYNQSQKCFNYFCHSSSKRGRVGFTSSNIS